MEMVSEIASLGPWIVQRIDRRSDGWSGRVFNLRCTAARSVDDTRSPASIELEMKAPSERGLIEIGPTRNAGRLRAFALSIINQTYGWSDTAHEAIAALSNAPTDDGWRSFGRLAGVQDGTWFFWRDPGNHADMHVDRAITDEAGRIEGKDGCGLNWYTECQPCRFDDEVAAAVLAYQERKA